MLSLEQSKLPRDWKSATIGQVWKTGGKHLMNKSRPVTTLSNMVKLMESIFQVATLRYLKENNLPMVE